MVPDCLERVAAIVSGEVLHVLEEKHLRAMVFRDLVDLEEKGSAGVFEPFLLPGNAEGLTGESAAQNIMFRDSVECFGRFRKLSYVSEGDLTKVHEVSSPCVLVPLAGKDAGAHHVLPCDAEASDAGEEVNEGEGSRRLLLERGANLCKWFRDIAFTSLRYKLLHVELWVVGFVGEDCQVIQGELIPGQGGCKVRWGVVHESMVNA